MGQAKSRGSFEQRQADAIKREAEAMERREQEFARRREAQRAFDAANPRQHRRSSGMTQVLLSAALVATMSTATKE